MTHITKDRLKEWAEAAGIRALRTWAQTALALIPAGVTLQDVSWEVVVSTALLAAVVSLLMSIAGIPEAADGKDVGAIMAEDINA